jgi:hypothetical protein
MQLFWAVMEDTYIAAALKYGKNFWRLIRFNCRTQWPRGLRHELSSLSRTLGSWVWIPLKACMSVSVHCACVVLRVVAALRRTDPPYKEPYWLCIRSRNWKSGQGPTKGRRAIMLMPMLIIIIIIIIIRFNYFNPYGEANKSHKWLFMQHWPVWA